MTKKWIDELDSDDFDTRQSAAKELRAWVPTPRFSCEGG